MNSENYYPQSEKCKICEYGKLVLQFILAGLAVFSIEYFLTELLNSEPFSRLEKMITFFFIVFYLMISGGFAALKEDVHSWILDHGYENDEKNPD